MCGICGIIQIGGEPRRVAAPGVLDRMTDVTVYAALVVLTIVGWRRFLGDGPVLYLWSGCVTMSATTLTSG